MSRRRARRNRGGDDGSSAPRNDDRKTGEGGGKGRNRRRRNRSGNRPNRRTGTGFWGDPERLPAAEAAVVITEDPDAVPRSLGLPPLPGREKLLAHYLEAVYDRAVQNAGALAAVSGLVAAEDLTERSADDAA